MKTAFAIAATLSLALTACERAPADGSSEEPATENEAPLNPSVPGDEPTVTAADYDGPMPIRIGTNGPEMDSCASYGEVSGLEDAGETYLSVRDAPCLSVKERDRLDAGQGVHICAQENGWYGVVYDTADEAADCGTDAPVDSPRNYTGPCAQGWVEADFVTIVAG